MWWMDKVRLWLCSKPRGTAPLRSRLIVPGPWGWGAAGVSPASGGTRDFLREPGRALAPPYGQTGRSASHAAPRLRLHLRGTSRDCGPRDARRDRSSRPPNDPSRYPPDRKSAENGREWWDAGRKPAATRETAHRPPTRLVFR